MGNCCSEAENSVAENVQPLLERGEEGGGRRNRSRDSPVKAAPPRRNDRSTEVTTQRTEPSPSRREPAPGKLSMDSPAVSPATIAQAAHSSASAGEPVTFRESAPVVSSPIPVIGAHTPPIPVSTAAASPAVSHPYLVDSAALQAVVDQADECVG